MLSLASLAHREPCAEASHPHFRPVLLVQSGCTHTSAPRGRSAPNDTSFQDGGGRPRTETLHQALGSAAVSSASAPTPSRAHPPQPRPPKSLYSRACAGPSPFFDGRIKLLCFRKTRLFLLAPTTLGRRTLTGEGR